MQLFKTVDEKLFNIGFIKKRENKYGVVYSRKDEIHGFTQEVHIKHKQSGKHLLQSYDPELMDEKKIGNTGVGLTGYEMKLFLKKMKQIGLYSRE